MSEAGASGRDDPAQARSHSDTVYFLSDYGLADEFVGVVHAVVRRLAPRVSVIDLTHGVTPFDVRGGAGALARAAPHLGPGVVLAVVDPGVGGTRRGVIVETGGSQGPRWLVGPDNGLLVPAAELAGGMRAAWVLTRPHGAATTFDGRDVFAPAAALLCVGADPNTLGRPLTTDRLVRLPRPFFEPAPPGGRTLRAEVTWVDRFGNVQLAAPGTALAPAPGGAGPGAVTSESGVPGSVVMVTVRGARGAHRSYGDDPAGPGIAEPPATHRAHRAGAFSDLEPAALGLLSDANGQLAIVVREGSAAQVTGARPGDVVELTW